MISPIEILNRKNKLDGIIIETKRENYKNNFIEINIYKQEEYFSYGYKIKVLKTISQKVPHEDDYKYTSKQDCLCNAKNEIRKKCSNDRKTKKFFIEKFPSIVYNQLELF